MITININSTDHTEDVEYQSVQLNRALTSQIDTLRFKVVRKGAGFKPELMQDVEIWEDATQLFGGQIVEMNETVEGKDVETFECTAKDYSFDMDRNMVIASYEEMTVEEIIDDINTNFLPAGYDIANVVCPIEVNYIAFNYEYPSKCLQQLAELVSYDWYVDQDKKIFFFSKTANVAPFDLTDDNENYYYNSLVLKKDIKSLRNTIIVRGGTYKGESTSETQIADGTALIYKQGVQYSEVFVNVNSVAQTVGVDYLDDPASFDCLYNFQEKFVRFKAGTLPAVGLEVEVGGLPHIPVIVKVKDPVSVAEFGAFEYKIVDKSIITKEGARLRAKAEIAAWANEINEGGFETKTGGLEVGQKINVQSTIRGTDQDYVISRISSSLTNGQEFLHKITLVTTRTYGMVEFLQGLLIAKDKEITINKDEVLDEVESVNEEMTISEEIEIAQVHNPIAETITVGDSATVQALDYDVEFVAGPQAPSSTKRTFILDGSRLG